MLLFYCVASPVGSMLNEWNCWMKQGLNKQANICDSDLHSASWAMNYFIQMMSWIITYSFCRWRKTEQFLQIAQPVKGGASERAQIQNRGLGRTGPGHKACLDHLYTSLKFNFLLSKMGIRESRVVMQTKRVVLTTKLQKCLMNKPVYDLTLESFATNSRLWENIWIPYMPLTTLILSLKFRSFTCC